MTKRLLSLLLASGLLLPGLPHSATAQTAPVKQWDKTFGGILWDNSPYVQQTADGSYILGGSSGSSVSGDKTQPARGFSNYWVIKLDATGSKQWDKTYGGNNNDKLKSLLLTRDGGYLLAGDSDSGIRGDKT